MKPQTQLVWKSLLGSCLIAALWLKGTVHAAVGDTWQSATQSSLFSARQSHACLSFQGKLWVLGGDEGKAPYAFNSEIWSSDDGVIWDKVVDSAPWGKLRAFGSVVYDGKMWVIGGNQSDPNLLRKDVWSSADGVTWTQVTPSAPWEARHFHKALNFQNKLWILGGEGNGNHNDVWSSSDGAIWTQATASAEWTPRHDFGAVVYNEEMWVFGGYDGEFKSDVWKSTDGSTWSKVKDSASWGPLYAMTVSVFQNQMWLIGGWNNVANAEVWSSSNGVNWTKALGSDVMIARRDASSAVFKNRLWVVGGGDGTVANNDISFAPKDSFHSANENLDNRISLSELLRVIQFYNTGGYTYCPDAQPETEDGFCPEAQKFAKDMTGERCKHTLDLSFFVGLNRS